MPPFLLKHKRRYVRIKNGIEIHVNEIIEVLDILACHGITGLIRIGECIQKCLQRSFQNFNERFLDRIFS